MSDEPTRYVPTDQDLRSSVIYNAVSLVQDQLRVGVHIPDPAAKTVEYAEAIYKFIKEGQTND